MPDQNTPQTLPPDFFEKKKGSSTPQTLPPDFFSKKAAPEVPDAAAQAKASVMQTIPREEAFREDPRLRNVQLPPGVKPQDVTARENAYMKESGEFAGSTAGMMTGGALLKGAGKGLPAIIKLLGRASTLGAGAGVGTVAGGGSPKEGLTTAATTTALEPVAEGAAAGTKAASKLFQKADPLARINKLLGVGPKEIRVGKAPGTMEEFVTNPARGVQKAGIEEKALAKMTPLGRNEAIVKAKDVAGKQLEQVFNSATQQGKTVSLRQTVDDIFKQIPDKNLQAQTRQRLTQIVNKSLGRPNVFEKTPYTKLLSDLDKLTPTQAWGIRRGLDDFANFASEGTVKTFRDVATQMRRGISAETRKIVPESAVFDQQYSDLAAASKATQKSASKFAREAPESLLRKIVKRGAIVGGGALLGGAGYEAGKHAASVIP